MTLVELEALCAKTYQKVFALITDAYGEMSLREVGFIGSVFTPLKPAPSPSLSQENNVRQTQTPSNSERDAGTDQGPAVMLATTEPPSRNGAVSQNEEANGSVPERKRARRPRRAKRMPSDDNGREVAPPNALPMPPQPPEPISIVPLKGGGAIGITEIKRANLKDSDNSFRVFGPAAFK